MSSARSAREKLFRGLQREIAIGSKEQALGIDEISKAIAAVDQVTQRNASAAEESASAAMELKGQASDMQASVSDVVSFLGGASVNVSPGVTGGPLPTAGRSESKEPGRLAMLEEPMPHEPRRTVGSIARSIDRSVQF